MIDFPSLAAMVFNVLMTDCGIGRILNWSLVTILPVASESILNDPVLLCVGNMTMQSSVRDRIVLSVLATVQTA